jgi:hypothetical protein
MFRIITFAVGIGLALLALSACGQQELISVQSPSPSTISPNGDGADDTLTISYTIGAPARVSVYLQDQAGTRYDLRKDVERIPSDDPYSLRFDGTVPGVTPDILQQVLKDGQYTWTVEATPVAGGAPKSFSGTIEVRDAASALPSIEDLNVTQQFSPNEDADEDVAYFNYRLPMTATVSINLTGPNGAQIPFISDLEEGPYAQSHIWNGKQPDGALVGSGVYTYTITARDTIGNVVQRSGPISVENPGRSEARITFVQIAPVEVALDNVITLTIRVKNTGDVPIKTHGPASGFRYTTEQTYATVENGQWTEKGGGPWRIGLDWGGGRAYPFRWAMSPRPVDQWAEPGQFDYLMPGEEVDVVGSVQIKQREDTMPFFAGLVHEGVGYPENNKGRTIVCVGIPGVESQCPR